MRFQHIIRALLSESGEGEWFEFKHNNVEPDRIGRSLSAIANSAALANKPSGYVVWGVTDRTHDVVGTTFDPSTEKKGNELLVAWLMQMLEPRINVSFEKIDIDGHRLVVADVQAAVDRPISFQKVPYVRVASTTRKLEDYPEKARLLWTRTSSIAFENQIARENVLQHDLDRYLEIDRYFELNRSPKPTELNRVIELLEADRFISPYDRASWNITNLGATLFARDLRQFTALGRKSLRVIVYVGSGRASAKKEFETFRGYAVCLDEALSFIEDNLPAREDVSSAQRHVITAYPKVAIREIVANALIHQDFTITGAGPLVEIFDGRIEVANPGSPLIEPARFIDFPPRSRNEALTALMRRMGFCEERGSGIDKVIEEVEQAQLPPPSFRDLPSSLRVTLFGPRTFADMDREERIRACYQHASLLYANGEQTMTNTTLRERFGLPDQSYTSVSRVIGDSLEAGFIKRADTAAGSRKFAKYVPFWA